MLTTTLFFLILTSINAFTPTPMKSIASEIQFQSLRKTILPLSTSALLIPGVAQAFDTLDDVEVADLPPVYVPILFAIFILAGVGVLTSSLGDVYTEEASLGLMSGAKAKKESERSRSSYFKRSD
jgi:hypothetical protein